MRLGAKADGRLTAIHFRAYTEGGIGQSARTGGPAGSIYAQCPNVKLEEYDVFTNAGPTCALRAPGHPQGAFGLECAMDELAHRLDMDPLEFRRKNEYASVPEGLLRRRRQGHRLGAPEQGPRA